MSRLRVGELHRYSVARHPLVDIVRDILGVTDLRSLHALDDSSGRPVTRQTDQSTPWHARFYAAFEARFAARYRAFMRDVVLPHYRPHGMAYQRVPTFRVQYPGNFAVGEFHRDGDYNHLREAENWFVPMTLAAGTATIWVESEPERHDYVPMDAEVGDAIRWDGVHLRHGNKVNATGRTRVSLDFRVVPLSKFVPQPDRRTINTGMAFVLGDYYEAMEP